MLVVDEYVAVWALAGARPRELPADEPLALPAYRHFRLLQRVHAPAAGQLSWLLGDADRRAVRTPRPDLLHVLDPRPLLDHAAELCARHRSSGLLVGETLAAGLAHGRQLWFGSERNVGRRVAELAEAMGLIVHVVGPG